MTPFTDADSARVPKVEPSREPIRAILPLDAVSNGFEPHWRETKQALLENLAYGSIRHRVVIDEQGTPKFDFPQLLEPGGAAVLPINALGKAGLVSIYRHAVLKQNPAGSYPDFVLPDDFGEWMWEAPRGYRKSGEADAVTPCRELFEETGLRVDRIEHVGDVITNSAFAPTPIQLFLAFASATESQPEYEEGIRAVRFFSRRELETYIKKNEIRCSVTLSLLLQALLRSYIH